MAQTENSQEGTVAQEDLGSDADFFGEDVNLEEFQKTKEQKEADSDSNAGNKESESNEPQKEEETGGENVEGSEGNQEGSNATEAGKTSEESEESEGGKKTEEKTGEQAGEKSEEGKETKPSGNQGDLNPPNENVSADLYNAAVNEMKKINPEFDVSKSNFSKEDLTTEDVFNNFTQEYIDKKLQDPVIKNYLLHKSQNKEFNPQEWVNNFAETNQYLQIKDSDEFLKTIMKNYYKDQYDEETINDYVDNMNKIQRDQMAKNTRANIQKKQKEYFNSQNKELIQARQQEFENEEKENYQKVDKYVKDIESNKVKPVIDMDEKEFNEFSKAAPELIKRDQNTGLNMVESLMQNDDFFLEMMPIIYKHWQNNLKGYSTQQKEAVKDSILKTLRTGPQEFSRSANEGQEDSDSQFYGNDA